MPLFKDFRRNMKEFIGRGIHGGDLIYQIDISKEENRRGLINIIKTGDQRYTGMIRLHLNEASMLYKISLEELENLSIEITKALDAVKVDLDHNDHGGV